MIQFIIGSQQQNADQGRHSDLKWAWLLMVDHLIRHDIKPSLGETNVQ